MLGLSFRNRIAERGDDEAETKIKAALKSVALWCLIISLVLTVAMPSSFENIDYHGLHVGRILEEAKTALLIGALLAVTLETSSKREQFRSFRKYLLQSEMSAARSIKSLSGGLNLLHFSESLENSRVPDIVKDVGRTVFSQYVNGLDFKDGVKIISKNWALESNRVFYDLLLRSGIGDLDVRVTHVGPPDFWSGAEAEQALQKQRELVTRKTGTSSITRIFIGTLSKEEVERDSKYRAAMEQMNNYNIQTGYVQKPDPRLIIDMTWIPKLEVLMLWQVEREGGGVDRNHG